MTYETLLYDTDGAIAVKDRVIGAPGHRVICPPSRFTMVTAPR
jgi:hypothetical protein